MSRNNRRRRQPAGGLAGAGTGQGSYRQRAIDAGQAEDAARQAAWDANVQAQKDAFEAKPGVQQTFAEMQEFIDDWAESMDLTISDQTGPEVYFYNNVYHVIPKGVSASFIASNRDFSESFWVIREYPSTTGFSVTLVGGGRSSNVQIHDQASLGRALRMREIDSAVADLKW